MTDLDTLPDLLGEVDRIIEENKYEFQKKFLDEQYGFLEVLGFEPKEIKVYVKNSLADGKCRFVNIFEVLAWAQEVKEK